MKYIQSHVDFNEAHVQYKNKYGYHTFTVGYIVILFIQVVCVCDQVSTSHVSHDAGIKRWSDYFSDHIFRGTVAALEVVARSSSGCQK